MAIIQNDNNLERHVSREYFFVFSIDYPIASKLEEWIVLEHLMLTDKMFKKYKYKKPIFIPVHK